MHCIPAALVSSFIYDVCSLVVLQADAPTRTTITTITAGPQPSDHSPPPPPTPSAPHQPPSLSLQRLIASEFNVLLLLLMIYR